MHSVPFRPLIGKPTLYFYIGTWIQRIRRMTSLTFLTTLLSIVFLCLSLFYRKKLQSLTQKIEEQQADFHNDQEAGNLNKVKNHIFRILAHDLAEVSSAFSNIGKKVNFLIQKNRTNELKLLGNQLEGKAEYIIALIKQLRTLTEKNTNTNTNTNTKINDQTNLDVMISDKIKK